MGKKEHDFESDGGGLKEIWLIAYPLILVNASNTIMRITDRKFLSISQLLVF